MLNWLGALASTLCTVLPSEVFLSFDFLVLDMPSFDKREPGLDLLLFPSFASRLDILPPMEGCRARLPKFKEDCRAELDCLAADLSLFLAL